MSIISARRYAETHPWISFKFDLNRLSHRTWLLLGEASSKCLHLAGTALAPQVAAELHKVTLTKGIHGTTSIEGNTLSEEQVRRRIDGDLDLPRSQEYLGREIDNILAIDNEIVRDVVEGRERPLTVARILEFHRRVLDGLPVTDDVIPGETRSHSVTVGISSYRGAPAEDCDFLLEQLITWMDGFKAPDSQPEMRFPIAILKAIIAHLYLAWIHPFGDGNGRVARLIEFQLLIEAGAPSPAAHLLSDHYNKTRQAYLVELDKTSRVEGYPVEGFVQYALQGFVDQLREQIRVVRSFQHSVTWINYVHEEFRDEETPAKRRQRHLVLDLEPGQVVSRNKLREVSPRLADEYRDASPKLISRDLNALLDRGLLVRTRGGYRANHELIEAFLPPALPVIQDEL